MLPFADFPTQIFRNCITVSLCSQNAILKSIFFVFQFSGIFIQRLGGSCIEFFVTFQQVTWKLGLDEKKELSGRLLVENEPKARVPVPVIFEE